MNRFIPVLKKISENLDLPQPRKSQVLLEVAADLDDIYKYHLSRGLNEQEAQREAEEKCLLSSEAAEELANIHQPRFRRFFLSLSTKGQILLERISLITVLCMITILSVLIIANADFIRGAGIFIWPVLIPAAAAAVIFIVKFYYLFIRQDHYLKYIKDWITPLLALGLFSFFISVTGYFINLYKLTSASFLTASNPLLIIILNISNPEHHAVMQDLEIWAAQSLIILLCGIASAMICALMWFIIYNKAFKIARDWKYPE